LKFEELNFTEVNVSKGKSIKIHHINFLNLCTFFIFSFQVFSTCSFLIALYFSSIGKNNSFFFELNSLYNNSIVQNSCFFVLFVSKLSKSISKSLSIFKFIKSFTFISFLGSETGFLNQSQIRKAVTNGKNDF